MRKGISLKKAKILHEESLDSRKRPIKARASSAYVVERISDYSGKVIKSTTRPIDR